MLDCETAQGKTKRRFFSTGKFPFPTSHGTLQQLYSVGGYQNKRFDFVHTSFHAPGHSCIRGALQTDLLGSTKRGCCGGYLGGPQRSGQYTFFEAVLNTEPACQSSRLTTHIQVYLLSMAALTSPHPPPLALIHSTTVSKKTVSILISHGG